MVNIKTLEDQNNADDKRNLTISVISVEKESGFLTFDLIHLLQRYTMARICLSPQARVSIEKKFLGDLEQDIKIWDKTKTLVVYVKRM